MSAKSKYAVILELIQGKKGSQKREKIERGKKVEVEKVVSCTTSRGLRLDCIRCFFFRRSKI